MKYIKVLFALTLSLNMSYADIEVDVKHLILQDYHSEKILFEKDSNDKIYPASLTKIMTTIVAFDLIKSGETHLDEKITISENAWRMSQSGYSSMFIMLNDQITVENLLKGIIIVSGNDACVALAEGLSGTEDFFVILMNEKAVEIGMYDTHFNNSSGINDPENYSTVSDILKMSRYLIMNYPEFYTYYKEKSFTWDRTGGDPITQGNRNPLLYKNIGVDGIKTGFLTVEQYSLASSILVGDRRLIAVGSGFKTKNARSRESGKVLSWGLRTFDTVKVARKDESLDQLRVWQGKKRKVKIVASEDIYLTVPKRKKGLINAVIEYNGPIKAPINIGDKLGDLKVYVSDELVKKVDILSMENVKRSNIFSRLFQSFNYLVWGDV